MNISELPEGCLAHIMSLTSPVDVLRWSLVSKQFFSASDSDSVWEKFLPSDYIEIIPQLSSSLEFGSKKELFLLLCSSHVLIDDGTKIFALDKWKGKKCYMLGARALTIIWGDNWLYWTYKSIPESRFMEVAELKNVCWLDIRGKIHTNMLTPNTTYGVYFVFKLLVGNTFGFTNVPVKTYVSEVDENGLPINLHHSTVTKSFYLKELDSEEDIEHEYKTGPRDALVKRSDGWMELEMSRYQVRVAGANKRPVVLEMIVKEVERGNWKKGLIVHGIELRPLD